MPAPATAEEPVKDDAVKEAGNPCRELATEGVGLLDGGGRTGWSPRLHATQVEFVEPSLGGLLVDRFEVDAVASECCPYVDGAAAVLDVAVPVDLPSVQPGPQRLSLIHI